MLAINAGDLVIGSSVTYSSTPAFVETYIGPRDGVWESQCRLLGRMSTFCTWPSLSLMAHGVQYAHFFSRSQ